MTIDLSPQTLERLSIKQVQQVFKNQRVSRYFPKTDDFAGGTFEGRIVDVERDLTDDLTGEKFQGPLFLVE